MSDQPRPFIVKSEKAFGAIRHWLKERGANTYSYSERNKINVGYDANPDSDWGKYTWKGSIIICSDELFEPTCKAIEKALGMSSEAGESTRQGNVVKDGVGE